MSTTTENGWTKQTPPVNGLYFWRADERDIEPEIHEIADGLVYRIESRRSEPVTNYGGEWLGPFTVSDFEQLAALRKAAKDALEWIEASLDYDDLAMDGSRVMAALREALKGESK